jgi:hypothetical protein
MGGNARSSSKNLRMRMDYGEMLLSTYVGDLQGYWIMM